MTDCLNSVSILSFAPEYAPAYKQLNIDWIEKYFTVEEHDIEQLDNPVEYIIDKGGYILFAKYHDEIAGTCALIKTGDNEFELVKMAVTESARGKQVGKQLGIAAIEQAKIAGAKRVWLESNRRLIPALNLYTKLGFKEIPVTYTPYARADIRMELWL
ncbi:hypothetical protein BH11BAC6_BH11BAC6_08140 [soil metagenome]